MKRTNEEREREDWEEYQEYIRQKERHEEEEQLQQLYDLAEQIAETMGETPDNKHLDLALTWVRRFW